MNIDNSNKYYMNCYLCPRNCGVNRVNGKLGVCQMGSEVRVNIAMLHFGEEPPITGSNGSGAVFFEGCSLRCSFCQNYKISRGNTSNGTVMSASELSQTFLNLQSRGAHNINLVTPMHFAPTVATALDMARKSELIIPVVVNTGGYEEVSTLKLLDGLVDIYLPDIKYYDSKIASECSHAPDYYEKAIEAVDEMYRQVGAPVFDENGIMLKGIIIRHLMLPGKLFDTKKILDGIHSRWGDNVYISLMNQYTPMPDLPDSAPTYLHKTVNPGHYDSAINYLNILEHENAFIQESDASGDELIPKFK